MRILYFAKDAPFVPSGYGKCCREITKRLRGLGHEVAVFATVGNQSSFLFTWEGIPIYPGMGDAMGEDVCLEHLDHFKADLLITQIDVWPIQRLHNYARQGLINWVPYVPIDSEPIPEEFIERLKCATAVVTMNYWAEEQLRQLGIKATTIHHGVDSKIYKYLGSREKIKQELGYPVNTFLVGMVQANQFLRKALEEQLLGIKIFIDKHPSINTRVYFLTTPSRSESYYLPQLIKFLKIKEDVVKFPSNYECLIGFSEEHMARLYNAFDVLLSATNGEGFGLPVIEAQACGCPVIATDCMSFPELVSYGELVRPKAYFTVPAILRKPMPDENDIAEKLEKIYFTSDFNRREIASTAAYRWDWDSRIINQWMMLLDDVREKIGWQCHKAPQAPKIIRKREKELCVF